MRTLKGLLLEMKLASTSEERFLAEEQIVLRVDSLLKAASIAKEYHINHLQEPERTIFWKLVEAINDLDPKMNEKPQDSDKESK